jgi:NADPH:quinone reductase
MKALRIQQHEPVANVKISDVPKPLVKPGEVLVRVEAAGINPSDVGSVEGRFPHAVLPRIIGRDFAGTVVDGPAELVGSKVWGTGGDLGIDRDGTHAEYLTIPCEAVARRPTDLQAEDAATVGVPFITAFSALVRLGQLKKDEWVIVSGAAGAVGQAAIQIAYAKGAHIVALVKDAGEERIEKLQGIRAVARSEKGDLETVVRRATGGRGADLALNGVGASIFGSLLSALGAGGRQVVYSVLGGREFTLDLMLLYRNDFKIFGLDTQKLSASQCAVILNELAPLFDSGALKPLPVGERYSLNEAPKAYQRVATHAGGKVVLVAGPEK